MSCGCRRSKGQRGGRPGAAHRLALGPGPRTWAAKPDHPALKYSLAVASAEMRVWPTLVPIRVFANSEARLIQRPPEDLAISIRSYDIFLNFSVTRQDARPSGPCVRISDFVAGVQGL